MIREFTMFTYKTVNVTLIKVQSNYYYVRYDLQHKK